MDLLEGDAEILLREQSTWPLREDSSLLGEDECAPLVFPREGCSAGFSAVPECSAGSSAERPMLEASLFSEGEDEEAFSLLADSSPKPLETCLLASDESSSEREVPLIGDDDAPGHATSRLMGDRSWIPGENCGEWVNRQNALEAQGRLLAVNACVVAARVPRKMLHDVLRVLNVPQARASGENSIVTRFVSAILRLSTSLVKRVLSESRGREGMWSPARPRPGLPARSSAVEMAQEGDVANGARAGFSAQPREALAASGLRNLVRLALVNAAEGRSWQGYVRDVIRYRLAGADVGDKYATADFAQQASSIGALVLAQLDARDFNENLPGLGIPSDFVVLADPVSIGESMHSRHGELLVMCLAIVSGRTGNVYHPLHSAKPMPIGAHAGPEMAEAMHESLRSHPAAWGEQALRSRLSGLGGDGALTRGGPGARHSSSGAAEILWGRVHCAGFPDRATSPQNAPAGVSAGPASPQNAPAELPAGAASPQNALTCTTWDPFHRVDVAAWRAVRKHAPVVAIFDLARELEYLFGQSDGALIFRALAREMGEKLVEMKAPGGTRKVVYLAGVPGSLVHNYKVVLAGLWARVRWKQAGHSNQSVAHLLDVARRLSSVSTIMVILLAQDIFARIVRPFARLVQKHLEPATFHKAQEQVVQQISFARTCVARLRTLFRVMSLCRQHLAPADIVHFLMAFSASPKTARQSPGLGIPPHGSGIPPGGLVFPPLPWANVATVFPTLFEHLGDLMGGERLFQGTKLSVPHEIDPSQTMALGPHCQCASRERVMAKDWERQAAPARQSDDGPDWQSRRVSVNAPRLRGSCLVPFWVAEPARSAAGFSAAGKADLLAVEPRISFRAVGARLPPGGVSASMFRRSLPRCRVSYVDFLIDKEMSDGLVFADRFLSTLRAELEQILTTVGVNESMSSLLSEARLR